MSEDLQYTLLYILLCICIIYPPNEIIACGLTIPDLFSSILGLEYQELIVYHIRRSSLMLFIYSILPLGYVLGLFVLGYQDEVTFYLNCKFEQILNLFAINIPR